MAVGKQQLGADDPDLRHGSEAHQGFEPAAFHDHDVVVEEYQDRRLRRARAVIAQRREVEGPRPFQDLEARIAPQVAQQGERIRRGAAVIDDDDFIAWIVGPLGQPAHACREEIGAVSGGDDDADRRPFGAISRWRVAGRRA